jgi:GntR family transcriptional regulator of arabinose operon
MRSSRLRFQYQQIAQEIEARIVRAEYAVGGRLPSERQLSEEFGVQRNTVRQALDLLEQDGHISTKGRYGSFILPPLSSTEAGTFLVNINYGAGPNGTALYEGISCGAEAVGFSIGRTNTDPLPDSMMNRIPDPAELPPDTAGVILWPHHPADYEKLVRLNEAVPVVLVDHRVAGASIDCVRFDDVVGGRLVTRHLLERGHRRIAFLTDEVFVDSVQARWCGYVLAHEEAGVHCDSRLGLMYHFIDTKILLMTLTHLLDDPETRPTAIVCSNDLVAFLLLRLLSEEGLRVPKDIAVTGYGNATPEYASAISLTTVHQPFYKMGLEASRVLIERIRQRNSDRLTSPLDICLPVDLVVRGSA